MKHPYNYGNQAFVDPTSGAKRFFRKKFNRIARRVVREKLRAEDHTS